MSSGTYVKRCWFIYIARMPLNSSFRKAFNCLGDILEGWSCTSGFSVRLHVLLALSGTVVHLNSEDPGSLGISKLDSKMAARRSTSQAFNPFARLAATLLNRRKNIPSGSTPNPKHVVRKFDWAINGCLRGCLRTNAGRLMVSGGCRVSGFSDGCSWCSGPGCAAAHGPVLSKSGNPVAAGCLCGPNNSNPWSWCGLGELRTNLVALALMAASPLLFAFTWRANEPLGLPLGAGGGGERPVCSAIFCSFLRCLYLCIHSLCLLCLFALACAAIAEKDILLLAMYRFRPAKRAIQEYNSAFNGDTCIVKIAPTWAIVAGGCCTWFPCYAAAGDGNGPWSAARSVCFLAPQSL